MHRVVQMKCQGCQHTHARTQAQYEYVHQSTGRAATSLVCSGIALSSKIHLQSMFNVTFPRRSPLVSDTENLNEFLVTTDAMIKIVNAAP